MSQLQIPLWKYQTCQRRSPCRYALPFRLCKPLRQVTSPCPALPCPALPCPALPCPALPLPCLALPFYSSVLACPPNALVWPTAALSCPVLLLPCPALFTVLPDFCPTRLLLPALLCTFESCCFSHTDALPHIWPAKPCPAFVLPCLALSLPA